MLYLIYFPALRHSAMYLAMSTSAFPPIGEATISLVNPYFSNSIRTCSSEPLWILTRFCSRSPKKTTNEAEEKIRKKQIFQASNTNRIVSYISRLEKSFEKSWEDDRYEGRKHGLECMLWGYPNLVSWVSYQVDPTVHYEGKYKQWPPFFGSLYLVSRYEEDTKVLYTWISECTWFYLAWMGQQKARLFQMGRTDRYNS